MSKDSSDKVQREIEELLDSLDNFVPEERLASKIRAKARSKAPGGPSAFDRLAARLRRISLGHVMLAGLALLVISWTPVPYGTWFMIAGLLLTGVAFVLSLRRGTGSVSPVLRSSGGEKRWRGQVIDYSTPPTTSRIRNWLRGLRRR